MELDGQAAWHDLQHSNELEFLAVVGGKREIGGRGTRLNPVSHGGAPGAGYSSASFLQVAQTPRNTAGNRKNARAKANIGKTLLGGPGAYHNPKNSPSPRPKRLHTLDSNVRLKR